MSDPVPLNGSHKRKIIYQIRKGESKQVVLEEFFPLISNKQKLVQFIAQVPSAYMRSKFRVLNAILAILIGFMFLVNLFGANYISSCIAGILLYLVITFKTYYYQWISVLSFFGMIPILVFLIPAIIQHAPQPIIIVLGSAMALGIAIMVMGIILNSRLSTKYTARYVEKTAPEGRKYKTFEYIFIEEQKTSDLLDSAL
jgi:hypothetical protein